MKIRMAAYLLFFGVMASAFLAGCGLLGFREHPGGNDLRIGMLENFNVSEKEYAAIIKQEGTEMGGIPSGQFPVVTYYDSLNSLLLGLESGDIDRASTYQCVAKYLIERNPRYEETNFIRASLVDSFCSAVRKEDGELLQGMNEALRSMDEDGTLGFLVKEYIDDVKAGLNPHAVELPKIPGAGTLKVAVTGDLPPLDLVLVDGSAAGFNTAILAEIGRRMGKNIEIVSMDSGSRMAALRAGRVDVVFWTVVPAEEFTMRPPDFDQTLGVATTIPYYKDEIVHIQWRKDYYRK